MIERNSDPAENCRGAGAGYIEVPRHYDLSPPPDADELETHPLFYRTSTPWNPAAPTLLVIAGGPGDDHRGVFKAVTGLSGINIVAFDHRGIGCSQTRESDLEMTISRAAADIEKLRQALLSPKKWWVYGVSYGAAVALEYSRQVCQDETECPIAGMVLDSPLTSVEDLSISREQFWQRFIASDDRVRAAYQQSPDKTGFLRRAFAATRTYGRRLAWLRDLGSANQMGQANQATVPLSQERQFAFEKIACREIWDYPRIDIKDSFYQASMAATCRERPSGYDPIGQTPADSWPYPVMVWAGQFDPIISVEAARSFHSSVPGAILWENPYAGHGLLFEKPLVARDLLSQLGQLSGGWQVENWGADVLRTEALAPPAAPR